MTTTKRIIALENRDRARLQTGTAIKAFDILLNNPVITIKELQEELGVTNATANTLVKKLESEGILVQINNKQRYRIYAYKQYIDIIEMGL
jgi:ribosomal protein S25